jgi:dienelactone hydrolase
MLRPLTLLSIALCSASAAASDALPLNLFTRTATYESAKISPTGSHLAVATPRDGQTGLGIIDLAKRKVSGGIRFQKGEHVLDYWWVGPERLVISIAEQRGSFDEKRWTGELYAINADGSNRTYLYGHRAAIQAGTRLQKVTAEYGYADVLDPLPQDPARALVAIYPPIEREGDLPSYAIIEHLDVSTGRRNRLAILPAYFPVDAVADRSGRLRFAYGDNERGEIQLFAGADTREGWQPVKHPGGAPEAVDLHGASPDGSVVYLTSTEASGRQCLREYRFTDGFKDLICSEAAVIGVPLFALDDNRPIGLIRPRSAPEFLDSQHPDARLLASLYKSFGGDRVSVTGHTLDGDGIVVLVDGDRNPGDYYLVSRSTKKAQYLISKREWVDPAKMTGVETVSYKARDGATIHGYLTSRAGAATKAAPLVLMPHGGPHGLRDWFEWHPWAQALASRGYAVLQVNFRGSGGYGLAHEQAGYRKWGTLMQDDMTDAVRWAIAQGIADPGRVCIMGASYGGYSALMGAVREPDLYRCAIAFAGVYDLNTWAGSTDIKRRASGREYLDRVLGDDADRMGQSPIMHLSNLKAPLLIAHGTDDERVPFSQAKQLRGALDSLRKPYEWLEFDGEAHGFYVDANHEKFLARALDFLDRHIGAAPAAPGAK